MKYLIRFQDIATKLYQLLIHVALNIVLIFRADRITIFFNFRSKVPC